MRVAIPLVNNALCMHLGHCEQFALIDVDEMSRQIVKREDITPPPHEPGLLPGWLAEMGVTNIIAGGMGQHALALFGEQNIGVIVGAPVAGAEDLVRSFLGDTIKVGENTCDH